MSIQKILIEIMTEIQTSLKTEFVAQGHNLTGKTVESIMFETEFGATEAIGTMFIADAGVFVNVGISADRIPYGGKSGSGGTSQYIQGLISFWENRGLSGRDAIGAAFATAAVHKREGMPTRASSRFSSTGERTGFVGAAIESNMERIQSKIAELYGADLQLNFAQSFSQYNNISFQP